MPAPIPNDVAAAVLAKYETCGVESITSRALGVPPSTVHDIVNGKGRWGEMVDDPLFNEVRKQQKKYFQVHMADLARKAMAHAEQALPKASFLQAVTGMGILIDKERLLANESTANISVHNRHEVETLDELGTALSRELIRRKGAK